ncbi:hypothetical protein M595_4570 [Lyngbya aestuarii BL J]|uniref:Uncharacterized protein n=1 Tax=Lyngbya aestuarii BL J TaxID=1348334 RepID=U7QCD0_9CYAN|nr:hypothetical protein [Lyngbya aestuarii]ERT05473.1 hypothetical protein M595_4570 [Lyngbya aestuarii BL J]
MEEFAAKMEELLFKLTALTGKNEAVIKPEQNTANETNTPNFESNLRANLIIESPLLIE